MESAGLLTGASLFLPSAAPLPAPTNRSTDVHAAGDRAGQEADVFAATCFVDQVGFSGVKLWVVGPIRLSDKQFKPLVECPNESSLT